MTLTADPHVAVEPGACLIVLVVRRWNQQLTPLLSQAETDTLGRQIAALSPAPQMPGTTPAVLGQLYYADQLCSSSLHTDFAQRARQFVTTNYATGNSLSRLHVARDAYPRCPKPWVPARDLTETPQAGGGYVRIVGLPCAQTGPSVARTQLMLPTAAYPVPCLALTATMSRIQKVVATQVLFFSLHRSTLALGVNDTRGYVCGIGDLAQDTLHAQRRTAPVRTTDVCYGTEGTREYLTLIIADTAAQHVLRTYRYHTSDFSGRSAEAKRLLPQLSFAWDADEYALLPTSYPVCCDAAGTLQAYEPALPPTQHPVSVHIENSH